MFTEPHLTKVKLALDEAFSITWEGCHKIYIMMDEHCHDNQVEIGYDCLPVKDKDAALQQLWEWFDRSCPLRFINGLRKVSIGRGIGNDDFVDVIPQFACDDKEG